ncbi:MAG: sialidase family protein [Planctomycetota bacterium]|jgi:hypothetical protein
MIEELTTLKHEPIKILQNLEAQGHPLRCSVSKPLQLSKGHAALLLGTEVIGGKALDYVGGNFYINFDSFEQLEEGNAVPFSVNQEGINPLDGKEADFMRFPPAAGFVPLGAVSADGKPLAGAGTGFSLSYVQSIPKDLSEEEGFGGQWVASDKIFRGWELKQLKTDGEKLEIVSSAILSPEELVPGYTVIGRGLSSAIADGDDLLTAVQYAPGDCSDLKAMAGFGKYPSGLLRWSYTDKGWQPGSTITDVTGDLTANEASLIRNVDGSLLMSARETGKENTQKFDVYLWHSADNGSSWELWSHIPKVRSESPVSLNQTVQGVPYIAGNLLTAGLGGSSFGYTREILCFWELTEDYKLLKSPYFAHCARTEFGMPPSAAGWRIDHPLSSIINLKDGKWYNIMTARVMAVGETLSVMKPSEFTGCHIMEVLPGPDEIFTPWKFEDTGL